MASIAKPRGSLPARVYWVRRGVLLALVLGLVFGVAQLVGSFGGGSNSKAAQVATTPTPSPSATATTEAPQGPCLANDIVVTPTARVVHGGGPITLKFRLLGKARSCTWQMSADTFVVKITSGSDRIWSSQDCPAAIPTRSVVVGSAKPAKVSVEWSGRRSAKDCPRGLAWARIGTYHVVAATVGGQPTDVQFDLVAPKKTVVTKTAKPKPSPTKQPTKKPTAKPTKKPTTKPSPR